MESQPSADIVEQIRDIPFYRTAVSRGWFPVLAKSDISRDFPDGWMTPRLKAALESGEAEFAYGGGADHGRTRIVRPASFPLRSSYRLWSAHPDIAPTWHQGCRRVFLTSVPSTEPGVRAAGPAGGRTGPRGGGARRRAEPPRGPGTGRPDRRTVRFGLRLDPERWGRGDVEHMLAAIRSEQHAHPRGWYHLECSGVRLAQLVRKTLAWGLWDRFPRPASVVMAYEYTPVNVRRYLERQLGCPVVELVGGTDLGCLYYSDSGGRYHPFLDRMSLELVPLAPGSALHGLVVTSVRNPYMPLIRYRSGVCVRTLGTGPDPARVVRFCGRESELLPTAAGPVSQGDLDDRLAAVSPRVFLSQLRTTGPREVRLSYTTFDGEPLGPAKDDALAASVGELTGSRCAVTHRAGIPIGACGSYTWLVRER
ncbi:hypothetical protein [Streptomyces sp. NPDC058953]|uniref:hypothetical protein n=1 Tax=unclassified Streptomyces TaxID=2593676 RepID=UPI00368F992F